MDGEMERNASLEHWHCEYAVKRGSDPGRTDGERVFPPNASCTNACCALIRSHPDAYAICASSAR
eukprot:scaffold13796_cov118-Isochrysis_galbana.AAC.7